MYFVTHGVSIKDNEYEYMTTVENVAYFMKNTDKADILFNGLDAQKWTISKEDFALTEQLQQCCNARCSHPIRAG